MKIYNIKLTVILAGLATSLFLASSCGNDKNDPEPAKAPSGLSYSPNTLSTTSGTEASSSTPKVSGSTPITYSVTTSPDAGNNISINAHNGVVTVAAATATGTYKATVSATNSAGTTPFADALTITVNAAGASTTFDADVKPIITASCSPCHVAGGNNTDYTVFSSARQNADFIINRINRTQGSPGFMPAGRTKLATATIQTIEKWKTDGLKEN